MKLTELFQSAIILMNIYIILTFPGHYSMILNAYRKPVNHTSWVAVVTPTDHPKSVRNRCVIELFCGVVCVVTLPF